MSKSHQAGTGQCGHEWHVAYRSPPAGPGMPEVPSEQPEREFTIKARTQGQMVRHRFIRHRGAIIGFGALDVRDPDGLHLDRVLEDSRMVGARLLLDGILRQRGNVPPSTSCHGSMAMV